MSVHRKTVLLLVLCTILGTAATAGIGDVPGGEEDSAGQSDRQCQYTFTFGQPEVRETERGLYITVAGAERRVSQPGQPALPYATRVITFPLGTVISHLSWTVEGRRTLHAGGEVAAAPALFSTDGRRVPAVTGDHGQDPSWVRWRTGGGLHRGERVTFLVLHVFPVRYLSERGAVEAADAITVDISYRLPEKQPAGQKNATLLIITVSQFARALQPLVEHKESRGVATTLVTLEDIVGGTYCEPRGIDVQEHMKYFIRQAVEEWGVTHVLLVGDIQKVPIRTIWFVHRQGYNTFYWEGLPTDLYYADLYDGNGSFASWNTNGNHRFGELYTEGGGVSDAVDLYADVYVGRLACQNRMVVKSVVRKIIGYEENVDGAPWFRRLILVGGDTFPGWGVVEGEFMNQLVAETMPDCEPVRIWYSRGNLEARTVNREWQQGAGFLHYSGHGFPWGWGTHPINGTDEEWVGTYYTPYAAALFNGYRLPVVFLDACSTAKLDFNTTDLKEEAGLPLPNVSVTLPCFAWYLVQKGGGGAVATVGATRVAYTGVDEEGPYAGAGYLGYRFFGAYGDGATPATMLVSAQNDYLNHLWKDRWTIPEFILLGDPSLALGDPAP